MGGIREKLDCGAIVWIIFIIWSIFTSIQIFSLIYCHHLSTTPATILSWGYFNTPAILFKTSYSVAVLWLTATLARINKRKWSFRAPLVCANHFFPYKPHTQTCLTPQSKWVPEEKICLNINSNFRGWNSTELWIFWIIVIQMSNLFIQVTNFKIAINNLNSKFCIYYLKSWYFLNNSVSNFLGKKASTRCASCSYNLGMKNWNQ